MQFFVNLERRNMASNFLKAINDAKISVTTNRDGTRRIGGNAHMDREENQPHRGGNSYRGRSRGRGRNRGGKTAHFVFGGMA